MAVIFILTTSILLQFSAAFMAFRLIPLTGKRLAWSLIAAALGFMALRRCISLLHILSGDTTIRPDLAAELVALAISLLLVVGIAGIAPIFSERRRSDELLAQAVQEWQATFDATNDAVWILDRDQRVVRSNRTAEPFFHRPCEGMISRHCWEIVHGTTEPIPECPLRRAKKSLRRETMELQSGDRWFFVTVDPILDAAGRYSGAVHIVSDITERKSAEEALRRSEENFRHSLADSPLGVRIVSQTGETLYANGALLDIYGYASIEELKTTPTRNRYTAASYAEFRIRRDKRKRGEEPSPQYEIAIVRKDGEVRQLQVFRKSMLWNNERQFQVIYQDITERARNEDEKAKLQNQLLQSQKMEAVGQLAGGVAHDFNNMLGVILGHTEIALDRVAPGQPLHADLREIKKAAERSAELTRQLLAFARKQTIAPQVLDLNETVEGMLKLLRRLIGEDIHLAWLPGPDLWPVRIDPSQIDQLLANLCVNARHAIAGIGKVTIETGNCTFDDAYCTDHAAYVPGEYAYLAVSDNGCGMNKETRERIFEPFFTTKATGQGTGLGLATVYGIVKQNSGFINVYSEPAQGTTFKIYLPRRAGLPEEGKTEGRAEPITGGRETILVAEDEPALLELTTMQLAAQGYTVLAARTPGEAIRLAGEYKGEIHLLLTDVIMPEMNGQELARELLARHANLKCLFTSGYTANVIAHHGVLDEGVHFIQKPFSKKNLAARVRALLDLK